MASLKDRLAQAAAQEGEGEALLKEQDGRFAHVPVEAIEPDPGQPRKTVGKLDDLAASIKEHGIIQPIVVSPHGDEKFRIIAGERRFSAAIAAGLRTVPALIRTIEEHRRLEVQLIENIHRQELSPLEEAEAFQRLMEEFQLSQRQLAARLSRSPASVNETLRILSLPQPILESVQTSEHLTRSVLLEMAKLEDEKARDSLWRAALDGRLTVKAARQQKAPNATPSARPARATFPFKTLFATVSVIFPAEQASLQDVVSALEGALHQARLNLAQMSSDSSPDSTI